MKVAIRTDASSVIGSGHLMRCLTLASELRKSGTKVQFICSDQAISWIEFVRRAKFSCEILNLSDKVNTETRRSSFYDKSTNSHDWKRDVDETTRVLKNQGFDWLFVDHYWLDWRWESAIRSNVRNIMAIDDLADRKHECDIVLDCVYGRRVSDYTDLVPKNCQMLLGTEYALLRPEFVHWRSAALKRRHTVETARKILISFGGVDRSNLTGEVLENLLDVKWPADSEINIVAGSGFAHKSSIKQQINKFPLKVTIDTAVVDMAKRITNSDLGIGAFGMSTWERYCLGLPSIDITSEENQRNVVTKLKQETFTGVIHSDSIADDLTSLVNRLMHGQELYQAFSFNCSQIVDGKGLYRVAKRIREIA